MTSAICSRVHLMCPVNQPIKDWSPFYCLMSGKLCLKLKVDILLLFFSDSSVFRLISSIPTPQRLLSQDVRNHIHYLKVSPNSRNSDREYFLIFSCTELSHECQHAFPVLSVNNLPSLLLRSVSLLPSDSCVRYPAEHITTI